MSRGRRVDESGLETGTRGGASRLGGKSASLRLEFDMVKTGFWVKTATEWRVYKGIVSYVIGDVSICFSDTLMRYMSTQSQTASRLPLAILYTIT
jgi:hypothetical protein